MATREEMTDEQLEQMREWIDLQVEQIRLGKKDNEQAIKLWLERNKYGKVIAATSKATSQLTKGFVESATSLADSTGDFGALSGVVGGTIKSISSLAGVVANIAGEIPFVGGAIEAVTDATIAFAKFGMGELQKSVNSFQDLSEAGQIGAGGVEEMTKQMRSTNLPLATYTKLLKENSTDLAFLSESAIKGGKSFSNTMSAMAKDTGMPLRRLGLSVTEIGDTVVDFQVMNRRQGVLNQLSQEQIRVGTEDYAKELDLIAKLTGKSRKEVQKEREETMSDSRFRAAMMDRSEAEQKQHMDAIAQISDPTLKRAYMDQVSGFTNSTASITAEISGMGGSIRGAIAHIDDLGGTSTEAVNIMREQARAVTETGGVLQSYSKVVESGAGVMMNFGQLADFAVETFKSQKDAADAQAKQMASVGSAADALVKGMSEMQEGTSIMNALFTQTSTAAEIMGKFASVQTGVMRYLEGALANENPGQKILDDAANGIRQQALDVAKEMRDELRAMGHNLATSLGFGDDEKNKERADALATDQRARAIAITKKSFDTPMVSAPTIPKQKLPNADALKIATKAADDKLVELANYSTSFKDGPMTTGQTIKRDRMEEQLDRLNATVDRLLKATQEGTTVNQTVTKELTKTVARSN